MPWLGEHVSGLPRRADLARGEAREEQLSLDLAVGGAGQHAGIVSPTELTHAGGCAEHAGEQPIHAKFQASPLLGDAGERSGQSLGLGSPADMQADLWSSGERSIHVGKAV
ncbi:unnamed protein product [Ilex paraguariensis]|uniref:Uncharacterized protein n=1 Tax=Ilex paraguariensis TaxID=185542 RepID=A0ABC8UHU9_9AQUA